MSTGAKAAVPVRVRPAAAVIFHTDGQKGRRVCTFVVHQSPSEHRWARPGRQESVLGPFRAGLGTVWMSEAPLEYTLGDLFDHVSKKYGPPFGGPAPRGASGGVVSGGHALGAPDNRCFPRCGVLQSAPC